MYMVRCRIRRLFLLLPLLLALLIILTLIIINNGLHNVFYDYQFSFHGVPGSYVSTKTPNDSYCNFRYGLPEELLYEDGDLFQPLEEGSKSPYRVLANVVEAKIDAGVPGVTYATHVTADFLNYVAEIVRFWEGPLSVAVFVPDFDADLTITVLNQLCRCVPEMGRVSVHFVFPLTSPPYLQNNQEGLSCEIPDTSKLSTFRTNSQMMYPINVCRNVARHFAQTADVMVSDVQLVPSEAMASRFVKMPKTAAKPPSLRVYVVPVFEVEAHDVIPRTKDELLMMVRQERAVYFHRRVCSHCQKFPGIKSWLESGSGNDDVKPFVTVRREYPFHRWEPIYIGSKNDPLYSEALSWEGLQDKMTQMLEMCLIGYQFVILDGAFLVHWPGIKKEKHMFLMRNSWRNAFQKRNSEKYAEIVTRLRNKYEYNPKCKLQ